MDGTIVSAMEAVWHTEIIIGPKVEELARKWRIPQKVAAGHDLTIEYSLIENHIQFRVIQKRNDELFQ
jgi:hypothetical protein